MLTGLRIGNFKAFGETQHIPIKPLTLIFGANSSGKSSIIHGLLLACQVNETGNLDVYQTRLGGEAVNLGGFRQFVHRRDTSFPVEIGTSFDFGYKSMCFDVNTPLSHIADLGCTIEMRFDNDKQRPFLHSCAFLSESHLAFRLTAFPDPTPLTLTKWHITELNASSPLFADHQYEIKWRLLSKLAPEIAREMVKQRAMLCNEQLENLFLSSVVKEKDLNSLLAERGVSEEDFHSSLARSLEELNVDYFYHTNEIPLSFSRLRIDEDRKNLNVVSREYWLERIHRVTKYLADGFTQTPFNAFDNLGSGRDRRGNNNAVSRLRFAPTYLGPMRTYPPRHIVFANEQDPNWLAGGGYAWDRVRTDEHLRASINKWFGNEKLNTRYSMETRKYTSADGQDSVEQLILRDDNTKTIVSHRDVGFGISQVLPVLVAAYASEDETVCIEQPELHLHPALQAELGDVFIEAALGEHQKTFLLETHSEHLILRIMRRMRDTARDTLPDGMPPVRPEDVAILYVQTKTDGSSSIVSVLELDEEGQLLDPWPGGFFEEGFRERFA